MRPDAARYDPRPEYLLQLIAQTGMSVPTVAKRIGIGDRLLRFYLTEPGEKTFRIAPYPVQFALECLARGK